MNDEDLLYDLMEREAICQYDGKQMLNSALTIARQQLIGDLKNSGMKNYEAVFKVKKLTELDEYRQDGAVISR